jgi:hypothetical protein
VGHQARYGTRIELLVLALGVDNLLVWLYKSLAKIARLVYTLASRLTEGICKFKDLQSLVGFSCGGG